MTHYVFSTLTSDNAYAVFAKEQHKEIPIVERSILIHGGHGVANKHLVTPKGVMTIVSDEDYEILKNDYHFKEHVRLGFITVERKAADAEEVSKNMVQRDASAPLTPEGMEVSEDISGAGEMYSHSKDKKKKAK